MASVRLIAKTIGVEGTEYEGKSIDQIIVGIARISSSREINELFDEPEKLLRHCISNSHWSIFSQANLSFEVITSRAIGRELLRHWSLRPQEFCIHGDSEINVLVDNSVIDKATIRYLYENQHLYKYKVLSNTSTNLLITPELKQVFYNGLKPMYKVTLDTNPLKNIQQDFQHRYEIICTKEHKFRTDNIEFEFKSLEELVNLQLKDDLTVESFAPQLVKVVPNTVSIRHCLIKSIEYVGYCDSYDLEVDDVSHNYVANGIIVHNSQRYAEITEFEDIELRLAGSSNRQSSTDVVEDTYTFLPNHYVQLHLQETEELYRELLDKGIAKETARFILPETTQTKLIFNGTIREWLTTLNQRLHKTAQKECRIIAELIRDELIKQCPIICSALFNFEDAYDIHILDRVVLEKYGVYQMIKDNQFKKLK